MTEQNQSIPLKPTTQTKEQRAELLRKAKILDDEGNFHKDFFSAETIAKDKARKGQQPCIHQKNPINQ